MTDKEMKIQGIVLVLFFGFLIGYLTGILLCRKMPERFGIIQREQECSCACKRFQEVSEDASD